MKILVSSLNCVSFSEVQIFGFIACHLNNSQDFELLKKCVDSATSGQTRKLDLLCVSYSTSLPSLKAKVVDFASSLAGMNSEHFVFLYQTGKKEQFVHYRYICEYVKRDTELNCGNALIIFGDHDDLWADNRVEVMSSLALKSSNRVCVFLWYFCEQKLEVRENKFEYWTAAVRFRVFADFFEEIDDRYLASTFCDCAFVGYLQSCEPELISCSDPHESPLYYYSGAHGGHYASVKHGIIKEMEESLMRSYPSSELPVNYCYECESGGFTLIKSVNIDDLLALKKNIEMLDEYIVTTK